MGQGSGKKIAEYRFADCRAVLPRREIWRGEELIAVEPKAFDLLIYLIENRERAVSKDELQDEIWRGSIVTEAALTRCVMKARRSIGDDPAKQQMIKTVRGHGYRFGVDVEAVVASTQASNQVELPARKPSVAVLPFANLAANPTHEYFSDGITDDIITELSRSRSILVIARHSAFTFRTTQLRIAEVARQLGVDYIVEGSVQRSDERIRLNVRLIDGVAETQLWSERYDREIGDVLVVQDELAAKIAATIGGRVEANRGRQRIDSKGVESYDCLLRAQALYYQVSAEANREAQRLLERAIDIEPENARALALLAAVHSMSSWSFWADDNERARQLSLDYGRRSIELDDTDSLAQALFAEILFDVGQIEQAAHHFSRALALNPNDIAARALYGSKLAAQGRALEGLQQLEIAEELDPFSLLWIPWIKGSVLFTLRRYEEAVETLRSMPHPPNEATLMLVAALAGLGRFAEADECRKACIARAREEMPNYPGDSLDSWAPIVSRMLDYEDAADLQHLLDSLRRSGWE